MIIFQTRKTNEHKKEKPKWRLQKFRLFYSTFLHILQQHHEHFVFAFLEAFRQNLKKRNVLQFKAHFHRHNQQTSRMLPQRPRPKICSCTQQILGRISFEILLCKIFQIHFLQLSNINSHMVKLHMHFATPLLLIH